MQQFLNDQKDLKKKCEKNAVAEETEENYIKFKALKNAV